jgi:hypothetical protein
VKADEIIQWFAFIVTLLELQYSLLEALTE